MDDKDRDYYGGELICESVGTKADMHCLAAAPELLKALKAITPPMPPADAMCHKGICPQEVCGHCQRIRNAHIAIGKAQGA
jgi:hypothetical protein